MFKLKLFSREVSSPWKVFILGSPWILARTDGGRNHYVMFVPHYLHKFLNLYISQTKELFQLQKQPPEVFYRKKLFLQISQYSQENAFVGDSFYYSCRRRPEDLQLY